MSPRRTVLEAMNLSIGHAGREPLARGLNLNLSTGSLVFLLGPNGVGKTTLLKTLAGLLPPIAGEIRVGGTPVGELAGRELARQRSIVLSGIQGAEGLTAREVVALGRIPHARWDGSLTPRDQEVIDDVMSRMGCLPWANRPLGQLSDGERQRILIARALAQETPIMFLDEPTAFIDLPGRFELAHLLLEMARSMDKAILLSAHDLHLALSTADRIWLLAPRGELTVGAPEQLVIDGAVERIFRARSLRFDPETGHFQRSAASGPAVLIEGTGLRATWTARAVTRLGHLLTDRPEQAAVRIHVQDAPEPFWRMAYGSETRTFASLEELLESLSTLRN